LAADESRDPLRPPEIQLVAAVVNRVERGEFGMEAGGTLGIGDMLAELEAAGDRGAGFGKEEGRPLAMCARQLPAPGLRADILQYYCNCQVITTIGTMI
jgi:hypothetical protein